jgi:Asp-tRNA(Asn)/Glu-tRNA(Gln) amidotransferase A subunit family amidase
MPTSTDNEDEMTGLNRLSAAAAARKLATREITAVSLLEDCLARIAARESAVHAWTFLDTDAALRRARELDAQASTGLLHGLPIGVKDLFDTCDMTSSYGSPIYANHRPAADAACVALARAAGAIIVGKTVTTEFANFHPGPTSNPHNPLHTPGGSSSGSAAAVADGMVPLAFGTQTAGSIIRPAAYCGVVGYKPTFGTVNRVGVKMISDTLDTIGALARSVQDAALFVAALADRPELMIERPRDDAPRVGLCRTHEWDRAHPETVTAFEGAARCLKETGASVRDVVLPPQFAGLVDAQTAIMVYEVARSLSYERLVHRASLSPEMIAMIDAGLAISPARYDAARALAQRSRATLPDIFADVDVLLAPSTVGEAPHGIAATGDPLFNRIWTLLHTPCVHLPCASGPQGLPVGITIAGPVGGDRATLLAADWIHARLNRSDPAAPA